MRRWLSFRRRPHIGQEADGQRFIAGCRSVADLVAPASVEVGRDWVRVDRGYARAVVVTGYPRTVQTGWLQPLLEFPEPLEVSIHVRPLDTGAIVRLLTHRLVQLQSSRLLSERAGRLADPERETASTDIERLRARLQRGDEKVFAVGLYLLVHAETLSALDARTRRVEETLDGVLAQSRVATLEQAEGLRTCLPEGVDRLLRTRNLDTSSAATMFPFSTSSLSMERGILYGVATGARSPVLIDPFDPALENANMVIFAKSGAGKSYVTKLLALRAMTQGVVFLVIDPEDEYREICRVAGGQEVRLASSSAQRLNPFDLPPVDPAEREGRDPLREQVTALLALLDRMLAGPGAELGPDERAGLEEAVFATYAQHGVTPDPATHGHAPPTMRDLHATLVARRDGVSRGLAPRLRRFVEGSLAGLFAGPTNVRLDQPMTVFNVRDLEPELRPVALHLVTSFLWAHVRRDMRPRLLVIDEAWSLVQTPEGGRFLASMARRARKYYLGLITITQDVADFLQSEYGRTVLTNASMKLLMKQDSTTVEPVVQAFGLSPQERQALLAAGKGEGLLFAQGGRVTLQVTASPLEHQLATTAPHELAALARAQTEAVSSPASSTASDLPAWLRGQTPTLWEPSPNGDVTL